VSFEKRQIEYFSPSAFDNLNRMNSYSNADFGNVVNPYLTDVGVSVVFGLGYYLIKYLYGDNNQKSDQKQLKETSTVCWDKAKTIEEFNNLIKQNEDDSKLNHIQILDKIVKKGLSADINTYNFLLNSCYITQNFEVAEKIVDEVMDSTSPVSPDLSTYNILLKGISCKLDQLQLEIGNERKSELIKRMDKLFEELLKKTDMKPNDVTINTILDILIKSGEIKRAWDLFDKMKTTYGVDPDKYSYSTIIKALKYDLDPSKLEKAFGILEFLKKEGNTVNDEIIFNCLLDVCVRLGKIDKAEKVFTEMKESKFAPSRITYAIMIKGFGQIYQLDKAFSVFEEMLKSNIEPNDIVYGVLLNSAVRCSNINKVTEIYKDILSRNVEMNVVLFTTLIKAYTKVRDLKSALNVYQTMMNDDKIEKNIIVHNAMLDCCVECKDTAQMKNIYDQIKAKCSENENNPQPDLITFSTVIKGYCRNKEIEEAFKVYEYLKKRSDFKIDEVVYNSILDGCAKTNNLEKAILIDNDMKLNNVERSNVTYSILIKLYSNSRQEEKALNLHNEMIKKNIKPGLIVYTCLIQTCLKSKKFEKAIELFEMMKNQGLSPDHVLYNIVVNGCLYHSRWEQACRYTLETFKVNIKIADDIYRNVIDKLCSKYCNMQVNKKCDYLAQIIKELKDHCVEVDYDVVSVAAKLIYKTQGKKISFSPMKSQTATNFNRYQKNDNNKDQLNSYRKNKI
jgi:pentatricopeptide repeat protein